MKHELSAVRDENQALRLELQTVNSRLESISNRGEKHHMMAHQVEIQDARLRDKKQVRRLNIAMTLAGCAFLVTTVGCVARIEDVRKNAQILPDVSTNITDVKLSMNHQVPGIMHVSLEEVPTAMMDETLPAKEIPQSGAPSSEEAVSISDDVITTSPVKFLI